MGTLILKNTNTQTQKVQKHLFEFICPPITRQVNGNIWLSDFALNMHIAKFNIAKHVKIVIKK